MNLTNAGGLLYLGLERDGALLEEVEQLHVAGGAELPQVGHREGLDVAAALLEQRGRVQRRGGGRQLVAGAAPGDCILGFRHEDGGEGGGCRRRSTGIMSGLELLTINRQSCTITEKARGLLLVQSGYYRFHI